MPTPSISPGTQVLFTRQRHEAKKAGLHWDYRIVVGDKAYSWATKKEMPEPGKAILLHEQPVHDAAYALSERVEIPDGNYGAGVTTLDFVRKAKIGDNKEGDYFTLHAGDEKYLIKKLDEKYGKKAWLFKNLTKSAEIDPALLEKFKTDLTPEQMDALGVLQFKTSPYKKEGTSTKDNFFGVDASMHVWPDKWLHEDAPGGWYDWYQGYAKGKRTPDDERQIKRWISFKARHLAQLQKADPSLTDLSVQPRRRQALLHWGIAPGIDVEKAITDKNQMLKQSAIKDGFTLQDHQSHAVETAIKRDGNILLSHPVGSGKTFSSIAVFEKLKEKGLGKRVLVVTPAGLRTNYGENGVKKFTDSNYVVYGNKQEVSSDTSGVFKEPHADGPEYGITSYEMFRENPEKYIKGHGADTVIFDEIHRIKDDSSKTFKALKDNRGLFRNFIGMTGSIVSNTPADVVPLVDAMTQGNHRLGSKVAFENRFVSTDKQGNKVVVNPILVRSLLAPYVHHVTEDQLESKGAVMKRPEKVVREIHVPLSGQHEEYYRFTIDQLDPVTKAKLKMGVGKLKKADMEAVFAKLLKSRQVANSMHTIDQNMSLEESAEKSVKVKRLLDDVENHLKETKDGQVIIHSELINGGIDVLEAGLKKRGLEYGKFIGKGNSGITEEVRQKDVQDYNNGKKKIMLISSAGGEGIDLPNTTFIASLDGHWNPEKINQVEARGIRMGGLSHRPEKDRKVIVNRYITKLPAAKIDVLMKTKRLLDPSEMLSRYISEEEVFYNPMQSVPTVDQMMYTIAKSKAHGNDQLKNLFEKTSAYSIHSDKQILTDYLNKYQNELLSGDYHDKWIDQAEENKYINRLRDYYKLANNKNSISIPVSNFDKYKDRTRTQAAVKNFFTGAIPGAVIGFGYAPLLVRGARATLPEKLKIGLGVGSALGVLGGFLSAKHQDTAHTTTPPATARKRLKLDDEQLRQILRGESVQTEQIKKTDHYIKLK